MVHKCTKKLLRHGALVHHNYFALRQKTKPASAATGAGFYHLTLNRSMK